jgi:hypothetical protein
MVTTSPTRARAHLAEARRKRALAQDASDRASGEEQERTRHALAVTDSAVSQALARVVLDEIEVNRARCRELEVEALELRAEGRVLAEMGMTRKRRPLCSACAARS